MIFVNYFTWSLLYFLFFVIDLLHMIEISNLQLLMTHQIYICNFLSTQKYYLKSFYSFNSKLISFPPHSDDMASLAGCFFLDFHIPSMLSIILLKLFLIYPFTFFFFPPLLHRWYKMCRGVYYNNLQKLYVFSTSCVQYFTILQPESFFWNTNMAWKLLTAFSLFGVQAPQACLVQF